MSRKQLYFLVLFSLFLFGSPALTHQELRAQAPAAKPQSLRQNSRSLRRLGSGQ